ncbi:MAG: hypothetical protein ACJAYB_001341 [Psychromonas sp.]|jgi:hypothetical protein
MTENFKNYLRLKRGNKKLVLQVCRISWHGPHAPFSEWKTIKTLDSSIGLTELDKEILLVRNNTRYFGKCSKCNEYHVQGHMYSGGYCQGCASSYLGVVY